MQGIYSGNEYHSGKKKSECYTHSRSKYILHTVEGVYKLTTCVLEPAAL